MHYKKPPPPPTVKYYSVKTGNNPCIFEIKTLQQQKTTLTTKLNKDMYF